MKKFRNPTDVHAPLAAYTHQIELSGNERVLFLSGQVGKCLDGSVPEDALEQLDIALEKLSRNLVTAGMDMNDILKITLYLVGNMDQQKRGEVLSARLGNHKPCMTLVYVAGLAAPIYKVELDAWASDGG